MINNDKKAVIHIAKKDTGMSEEEYRDLLGSVGVKSSKDLNNKTFNAVMGQFERLGYKSKHKTRKRKTGNLPMGKKESMSKIEAILLDMGLPWAYVDGMAKSIFKVDRAQWLEADELRKIMQMMIIHQKRQQKKQKAMR